MANQFHSTARAMAHAQSQSPNRQTTTEVDTQARPAGLAKRVMRTAWALRRRDGLSKSEALRRAWTAERTPPAEAPAPQPPAPFANRRTLLAGLAAFFPLVAQAQPPHPDAELLDAERRYGPAETAYREADIQAEALRSIGVPKAPDVLFLRDADSALGLAQYAASRVDGLRWFFPSSGLASDRLRTPQTKSAWRMVKPEDGLSSDARTIEYRVPWPEAQARADEIVTAFDTWGAETEQAHEASGFNHAKSYSDRLGSILTQIEIKIETETAYTIEGLAVKARMYRKYIDNGLDANDFIEVLIADILAVAAVTPTRMTARSPQAYPHS